MDGVLRQVHNNIWSNPLMPDPASPGREPFRNRQQDG